MITSLVYPKNQRAIFPKGSEKSHVHKQLRHDDICSKSQQQGASITFTISGCAVRQKPNSRACLQDNQTVVVDC